jgi:hypothetical protein
MATLHLVATGTPTRKSALNARVRRVARSAASRALTILRSLWIDAFPTPQFDGPPGNPSPKAAALREPALLSEATDAISKRVAG